MSKFLDGNGVLYLWNKVKAAFAPKAQGVPFVMGTQTAATGAWTGVADTVAALYDGLTIRYWLPYAGSGSATLNLTLAGGDATGPVNCYYGGTTRLTTHYPAGSAILMTYRVNARIAANATYTGWWADANYYSDSDGRAAYTYYRPVAGEALYGFKLCGFTADGKVHPVTKTYGAGTNKTVNTVPFDLSRGFALCTSSATYAEGATITSALFACGYSTMFNYAFNETGTAYRMIYLKGTASADGLFTLDDSDYTAFAVLVPYNAEVALGDYFADDGSAYVLVGATYSSKNYYQVFPNQPVYKFDGARLVPWHVGGADLATSDAPGYLSAADKVKLDGVAANANRFIHPTYSNAGSTPQTSQLTAVQLGADGVRVATHNTTLTYNGMGHVTGRTYLTENVKIPLATNAKNGVMSAADKARLDGLPALAAGAVTLTADGWTANEQTVSVAAATAACAAFVTPAPACGAAYRAAGVRLSAQGAGTLTFAAETTPAQALDVKVLVVE